MDLASVARQLIQIPTLFEVEVNGKFEEASTVKLIKERRFQMDASKSLKALFDITKVGNGGLSRTALPTFAKRIEKETYKLKSFKIHLEQEEILYKIGGKRSRWKTKNLMTLFYLYSLLRSRSRSKQTGIKQLSSELSVIRALFSRLSFSKDELILCGVKNSESERNHARALTAELRVKELELVAEVVRKRTQRLQQKVIDAKAKLSQKENDIFTLNTENKRLHKMIERLSSASSRTKKAPAKRRKVALQTDLFSI